MVVGAVEDVLVLVLHQRGVHVRPGCPGDGPLGLGHQVGLTGVGGALGQPVGPDTGLGGNQGEHHGDVHIFHKFVHIIQVFCHPVGGGLVEAGDQGVVVGEVDVVVLLLAQGPLRAGLQIHPGVPADELVGGIGLKVPHELAVEEVPVPEELLRRAEIHGRQLLQVAVFHLREGAVGGDGVGHQEHPDEGAEQGGDENAVALGHGGFSLCQNRKYRKGL